MKPPCPDDLVILLTLKGEIFSEIEGRKTKDIRKNAIEETVKKLSISG
jgi:hypothetical protein